MRTPEGAQPTTTEVLRAATAAIPEMPPGAVTGVAALVKRRCFPDNLPPQQPRTRT